jgi:putative membrane protein
MRMLLRPFILYAFSLAFLDRLFAFVNVANELSLIEAALLFLLLNTVFKPFLKILLLPINIITLGLFSWLIHVIIVFLVLLAVPGFHISEATFSAVQIGHYVFPAVHLTVIWTYIFFSFFLSIAMAFMEWLLVKRD